MVDCTDLLGAARQVLSSNLHAQPVCFSLKFTCFERWFTDRGGVSGLSDNYRYFTVLPAVTWSAVKPLACVLKSAASLGLRLCKELQSQAF